MVEAIHYKMYSDGFKDVENHGIFKGLKMIMHHKKCHEIYKNVSNEINKSLFSIVIHNQN